MRSSSIHSKVIFTWILEISSPKFCLKFTFDITGTSPRAQWVKKLAIELPDLHKTPKATLISEIESIFTWFIWFSYRIWGVVEQRWARSGSGAGLSEKVSRLLTSRGHTQRMAAGRCLRSHRCSCLQRTVNCNYRRALRGRSCLRCHQGSQHSMWRSPSRLQEWARSTGEDKRIFVQIGPWRTGGNYRYS